MAILLGEDYDAALKYRGSVKIEYTDEEKKLFKNVCELDFKCLTDRQIGSPVQDKMVEAIQQISRTLNSIKNELHIRFNPIHAPQSEIGYKNDSKQITNILEPNSE